MRPIFRTGRFKSNPLPPPPATSSFLALYVALRQCSIYSLFPSLDLSVSPALVVRRVRFLARFLLFFFFITRVTPRCTPGVTGVNSRAEAAAEKYRAPPTGRSTTREGNRAPAGKRSFQRLQPSISACQKSKRVGNGPGSGGTGGRRDWRTEFERRKHGARR